MKQPSRFLCYTAMITAGSFFALTGCVDRHAQAIAAQTASFVSDKTVSVVLQPVSVRELDNTVQISGNLTTSNDVQVGARQSGKIVAVYVKDGDVVSAGQPLAQQDTSTLQAQVLQQEAQVQNAMTQMQQAIYNAQYGPEKSKAAYLQAEAQLKSAQASYKKSLAGARPEERRQAEAAVQSAKTNLAVAKKDLERKQNLEAQGAIAKSEVDQAQGAYATAENQYQNALQNLIEIQQGNRPEDIAVAKEAVAEAQQAVQNALAQRKLDVLYGEQVASAKAQVEAAQAGLEVAKTNLAQCTITAPFAGRVSGNPLQVGTMAAPGTQVVHLVSNEGIYFDGQVPAENIASVKTGAPVSIKIDAFPGKSIEGHVVSINPVGQTVGRLFSVRVSLDNPPAGTSSNMFAVGTLLLNRVPNAIVVPATALVTKTGTDTVFTVENGMAKGYPVKRGLRVGADLQIIGVPADFKVVVQGQDNLEDGTKVLVKDAANPAASSTTGN